MTTTDLYLPQARASLGLVPETFDTARVEASFIRPDDEHPTVVIELPNVTLQTFRCNPLDVAAALRRLADRIYTEVGSDKVLDPSLPADEYHRRYQERYGDAATAGIAAARQELTAAVARREGYPTAAAKAEAAGDDHLEQEHAEICGTCGSDDVNHQEPLHYLRTGRECDDPFHAEADGGEP